MLKIDDNLLTELGLSVLPIDERNRLLAHIYETLELRVGMNLAKQMTKDQLAEFEQFVNANDEAGAQKWLEANFPGYKDVVYQELENLKAEIKRDAPQIIEASNAARAQATAAAVVGQPAAPVAPAAPAPQPAPAPAVQAAPPQPVAADPGQLYNQQMQDAHTATQPVPAPQEQQPPAAA